MSLYGSETFFCLIRIYGFGEGRHHHFKGSWEYRETNVVLKIILSNLEIGEQNGNVKTKVCIYGDPTFAHTTFAQRHLPRDICQERHLPRRHLPRRHLPRKTFAHKTFAQKTFTQKDICPERHFPRRHLPRRTFVQKDICPEDIC
jgi:hypothetical protein